MPIRSLRIISKLLSASVLLLVLTACGGSGTSTTNNQQGSMCSGCQFLYASTNANQILTYQVSSSGALGSPSSTPGAPNTPYFAGPPGGPVYALDASSNTLDAFNVNYSTGALTPMGSPFNLGSTSGARAGFLWVGQYLYVGDTNGTISAFNISDTGANPIAVPGSPFAAGAAPVNLFWSYSNPPNSTILYAADFSRNVIWAFTIGSTGALTMVPGSPFATSPNSAPAGMAAIGYTLYVALSGTNQIAAFSIGASGALTPVTGSPFPAGRGPKSLLGYTVDNGDYLYALNSLDHTISAYSMDQTSGILTEVQGSPFPAGTASAGIVGGRAIYVPDLQSNDILAFAVEGATGSLSPLTGSPFPTSVGPMALTIVDSPILTPP
jgi:6-phosphogluconolactonase (cycloisomerase 2 family)